MSTLRRRARTATALLAAGLSGLVPAVVSAQGQPSETRAPAAPVSPVIDGLEVNADAALAPGSALDITLRGTPHARASVLLPGGPAPLVLHETEPGVYVGRYTVAAGDRIDADGAIRASVVAGVRPTVARFRFPPSFRDMESAAVKPLQPIAPEPAHVKAAAPATAVMGAAAPAPSPLVLQVLAPTAGTLLTADSGLQVEGRTAPNAQVRTRIDAVPPRCAGAPALRRS